MAGLEAGAPGYYRSLARTMAVVVVLVSATPLALVAAAGYQQFHGAYRDKVLAHLTEVVQRRQQHIDLFLAEKLATIRMLFLTTPLPELADPEGLRRRLQALRDEYSGVFVDLGLIAADGVQAAYAGPHLLDRADYSGAAWFTEALRRRESISDVFLGLRGAPHFIITVRREWEGKTWVLRATIDFQAFNSLVEGIRAGATGTAFIINRKGQFQTAPRPGAPDMEWLLRQVDLSDSAAGPDPAGSEGAYGAYWETVVGRPRVQLIEAGDSLYLAAPLKRGSWLLIFQQAADDAFASLILARRVFLLIVALGGAGIVVMALATSRRMVRRIELADREKEAMNQQIIEAGKMASLGEMAAGVAHEINNPVAIMVEEAGWIGDIMGEGRAIAATGEDRAEIVKSVEQIRSQGRRCKEITHKLLSFARRIDPATRACDVNALAAEVAGLSEQRARYANIELQLSLAPDLPAIEAPVSEMQQVLLNLVNNAVDAMNGRGGVLRISTRRDGDRLALAVSDQGEGVSKDNLARIFDPFFTTKPVGKGVGLGLSIVYGIVKKMGGDIAVDSEEGRGATFSVRLPLSRPARPAEETVREAAA
jgi:two-component system, NtrC family, sensor kinase